MKKLSLFLLILLCSVNVFSIQVVSGLGIFYKTPYEEALKQLKEEGFEIEKTENIKDESQDVICVHLRPFVYREIPFSYGKLTFAKGDDGRYKFLMADAGCANPNEVTRDKIIAYGDLLKGMYKSLQWSKKFFENAEESSDKKSNAFFCGDNTKSYISFSYVATLSAFIISYIPTTSNF